MYHDEWARISREIDKEHIKRENEKKVIDEFKIIEELEKRKKNENKNSI